MEKIEICGHKTLLPIIIGFGVIALSTLVYKILSGKSKKIITLQKDSVKYSLMLIEKIEISSDTRLFRFALPSKNHILGLPVGQHVYLTAKIDDKLVIRPYTPTSSDRDAGIMDLVVKVYFKNVHPNFPNGGKMSQYLNDMTIGEYIDVRGPNGHLTYIQPSKFSIKKDKKLPGKIIFAQNLSMIAGGTGITPMLQLITAILSNPNDVTKISLVFANQTEQDILLRDQLETFADEHPEQFKVWYTVDRPSEEWNYSSGHIDENMLRSHLFSPSEENGSLVLMCGPPPMINFACNPNLDKIGFSEEQRFSF